MDCPCRPDRAESLVEDVARQLGVFRLASDVLSDGIPPKSYTWWPATGLGVVFAAHGTYYSLVDNGGELMLNQLNSNQPPRSIPATRNGLRLTAGVMAYRVACALRDEPYLPHYSEEALL